ncbi:MAG TPA: hypothetical protein VLD16_05900 [Gaiellaceae bacterium]|nr:hypothetical protein [Gaiellaceae bacterium]
MFRFSILFALAALALPAAALAKGPSEGSISGPGFSKTVKVLNDGGGGSPGDNLTQASGFFPSAFGQSPDPMLHGKPSGPLGPRYTVVWKVPGGGGETYRLRQDLYPYARGGAVAYTKPGQPVFGTPSRGGWYRSPDLKPTLVALGLARHAPSSSSGPSIALIAGLAAAAVLAAVGLLAWRRQRGHRSPSTSSTGLPAGSRT